MSLQPFTASGSADLPLTPEQSAALPQNEAARRALPAPKAPASVPKRMYGLYTAGIDFVMAALAWQAFFLLRRYILDDLNPGEYFSLLLSSIPVAGFWVIIYGLSGSYTDTLRKSRLREVAGIVYANLWGSLLMFLILIADDQGMTYYINYLRTTAYFFCINTGLGVTARLAWLTYLKRSLKAKRIVFNTILVGSEATAMSVFEEIEKNNPHLGIRFAGFVHIENERRHLLADNLVHLGHYTALEHIIPKYGVEQVIVATEPEEHRLSERILNSVEGTPARVFILPDTYQILLGAVKVNHILGTPLIEVRQHLMPVWQRVVKRGLDFGVSFIVLILLAPVYATLAILTRMSSPGPIIFSQERVGKGGKPFRIYKFRSMYIDAERFGPSLSSENDPRITPFGRFMRRSRLDELPQFWNVLKGDMSLVGPRPERQHFIDQIVKVAPHYKHLNRVRPGITSLGQVKFGYAENVDQMVRRLRYDIMYIENMSLAMDLRIMIFTVLVMLGGKGK